MSTVIGPEAASVLAHLDARYNLFQDEAEASERLRRPTPRVQAALRESGVFGLMLPSAFGGVDATPMEVFEVIEHLSHADASLGWLVRVLASETARVATSLPEDAAMELFGGPHLSLVAGRSTMVSGSARREGDVYVVSGQLRFAPGVAMASHVDLAVEVEGSADRVVCVLPRGDMNIVENRDMLGLRATATLDCEAVEVVVPERFSFPMTVETRLPRREMIRALDLDLIAAMNQAAWSHGVGRRLVDELSEASRASTEQSLLRRDDFYADLASLVGQLRGAKSALRHAWEGRAIATDATADRGSSLALDVRLFAAVSAATALEIGQFAHRFTGARLLQPGPIQRFFRDVLAGSQHQSSSSTVLRLCGQEFVDHRLLAGSPR